MKPFEKIQVDVKYLDDMPEFYPFLIRHRLPRYEYTARDVMTGFTFSFLLATSFSLMVVPNSRKKALRHLFSTNF
jgi:hypothetical protein